MEEEEKNMMERGTRKKGRGKADVAVVRVNRDAFVLGEANKKKRTKKVSSPSVFCDSFH